MLWREMFMGVGLIVTLSACAGPQVGPSVPSASASAPASAPGSAPAESKQQAAARARLRAVIRDRSFLEQLPMAERAKAIYEPFLGQLMILYLVDDRGAARSAQASDLAESGVTREALRAVVEWNLAQVLPGPLSCTSHAVNEPAHHGYYESSRLLFDKQWADLSAKAGEVVVAVPSNDTLFVACNPTPQILQKLSVIVQNTYPRASRRVSPSLLTWSAEGFRELPAAQ